MCALLPVDTPDSEKRRCGAPNYSASQTSGKVAICDEEGTDSQPLQKRLKTDPLKRAKSWSGRRESNPRMQLGKLPFYH
jgi:hypothetical protein